MTKEAVLWEKAPDDKVQCYLCSHRCRISKGKLGACAVRKNEDGVLYSLNYDKVCAANVDPVEKKPLFHYYPGSTSFSISAPGCNFRCVFCQNWQISQAALEGTLRGRAYAPKEIVHAAEYDGCRSIAYTYTEPTVFMELCRDCGMEARRRGIANVFVSNGYMTREAVEFCRDWLDAINVDLKAFTEDFYRDFCRAKLAPVLETIRYIAKETNIWMEITTLIVPGENDGEDELRQIADFIVSQAGPHVPWHVSRFYPQYRMDHKEPTHAAKLETAYQIGRAAGLHYVYVGNLPGARTESTFCSHCDKLLIERIGYKVVNNFLYNGQCPECKTDCAGVGMGG